MQHPELRFNLSMSLQGRETITLIAMQFSSKQLSTVSYPSVPQIAIFVPLRKPRQKVPRPTARENLPLSMAAGCSFLGHIFCSSTTNQNRDPIHVEFHKICWTILMSSILRWTWSEPDVCGSQLVPSGQHTNHITGVAWLILTPILRVQPETRTRWLQEELSTRNAQVFLLENWLSFYWCRFAHKSFSFIHNGNASICLRWK